MILQVAFSYGLRGCRDDLYVAFAMSASRIMIMCSAFDEEMLAVLQRAYDEVLQDLFGDVVPE